MVNSRTQNTAVGVVVSQETVATITDRGGEVRVLLSPKTAGTEHMIMGLGKIPPGESVKAHVHDYGEECFFVVQGEGRARIGQDSEIFFREGQAVRIPPKSVHSIENTGDCEMVVVFATSPLAPRPDIGHREIRETAQK